MNVRLMHPRRDPLFASRMAYRRLFGGLGGLCVSSLTYVNIIELRSVRLTMNVRLLPQARLDQLFASRVACRTLFGPPPWILRGIRERLDGGWVGRPCPMLCLLERRI